MGKGIVARAAVFALCAGLLCGVVAEPAIAARKQRVKMLRLINRTRVGRDLRPMRLHTQVTRVAQKHSRQMAARKRVQSSGNLPRAIRRWAKAGWGENVTCGSSLRSIHRRFMRDASSRRNILRPRFRRVGIGVVETDYPPRVCNGGNLWVTEIFFE